ncbi:hypothetical protein N302_12522, partial [Corvus brachyrhynchos]
VPRTHPQLQLAHLLVVEGAQRVQRARLRLHRHVRRQRRAPHPPLPQPPVAHAPVGARVRVPRLHAHHQRARRVVLRHVRAVRRLLEHRRVVVHVRHLQHQLPAAPQRRPAPVPGHHRHAVLGRLLAVQ